MPVGEFVGLTVGDDVGLSEGLTVGDNVGLSEGLTVGVNVAGQRKTRRHRFERKQQT